MVLPIKLGIDIKAKIPDSVTGRLVDSLIDVISPLSESLGLIGDHIRIHRVETVLKVAQIARGLLLEHDTKIVPIPLKGLLPLLERSSLEEANDDQMILMWGKLLAGAAGGNTNYLTRYTTILSELTRDTAKLFEHVVSRNHDLSNQTAEEISYHVPDYKGDAVLDHIRKQGDLNTSDLGELIIDYLDLPGIALGFVSIEHEGTIDCFEASIMEDDERFIPHGDDILGFSVLESLGLLKYDGFENAEVSPYTVSCNYYLTTPLGFDFYSCCNPGKLRRS